MAFFTRRKLLTLALAAPLCEGAYWLYGEWIRPSYTPLAWSPEGSSVLCDYASDVSPSTVIVPKRGLKNTVLLDDGGSQPPRWGAFSPDNKQIAFSRMGLYVADTDGNDVRKIGNYLGLGWSPDSEWIAVEQEEKQFEIHAQTGEKRKLSAKTSRHIPLPPEQYIMQSLSNGDFIIPNWDTDDRGQIWLVDGKTYAGRKLVRGYFPLVSPQGDTLAYSDERGKLRFLSLS